MWDVNLETTWEITEDRESIVFSPPPPKYIQTVLLQTNQVFFTELGKEKIKSLPEFELLTNNISKNASVFYYGLENKLSGQFEGNMA